MYIYIYIHTYIEREREREREREMYGYYKLENRNCQSIEKVEDTRMFHVLAFIRDGDTGIYSVKRERCILLILIIIIYSTTTTTITTTTTTTTIIIYVIIINLMIYQPNDYQPNERVKALEAT